jgi:hypothetical protein
MKQKLQLDLGSACVNQAGKGCATAPLLGTLQDRSREGKKVGH